jgi:lysozyme
MIDAVFLDKIKSFEGYTPVAKWDYSQFTNGYGTRARAPDEVITKAEAESRFRAEIGKAAQIVERHAANWDPGTKAALTSLTFNAGTRWISSGLGDAVRAGDVEAVRERFVLYVKAGGETLQGLVNRRNAEVEWIGSSVGAVAGNAASSLAGAGERPGTWGAADVAFAAPATLGARTAMPLTPTRSADASSDPALTRGPIVSGARERSENAFAALIVNQITEAALSDIGSVRDPDSNDTHARQQREDRRVG